MQCIFELQSSALQAAAQCLLADVQAVIVNVGVRRESTTASVRDAVGRVVADGGRSAHRDSAIKRAAAVAQHCSAAESKARQLHARHKSHRVRRAWRGRVRCTSLVVC